MPPPPQTIKVIYGPVANLGTLVSIFIIGLSHFKQIMQMLKYHTSGADSDCGLQLLSLVEAMSIFKNECYHLLCVEVWKSHL